VRGAGAGALSAPGSDAAISARTRPPAQTDPCPGAAACVRVVIANAGATPAVLALSLIPDRGTRAALAGARLTIPPGARREAEIAVADGPVDGVAAGRLLGRAAGGAKVFTHPFAVPVAVAPPLPLGPLELERGGAGRVTACASRSEPSRAGTRWAAAPASRSPSASGSRSCARARRAP
jgi:hypothetical protein